MNFNNMENTSDCWFDNAVIYHIYPLGYCGCAKENFFISDENYESKGETGAILRVMNHIPLLKEQGFNAIYFGPVFESTRHGYDTADYLNIDSRLGNNDDFKTVCGELHKNGIKIILDGVFNHVGRDFWAFKDVRKNGFNSRYKDWFIIRSGNSNYNDGFYYEGWEGHFELVKLNLKNPEIKDYLKNAVKTWVELFDIDGLRLDVAYCLELDFLRELRGFCKNIKRDFWLMGETLHGDYNKWMNPEMLDSVTNYECYKGIYSSFNELNMFEIAHSFNRQFGKENWCLYRGKKLYAFADNHDVSRIASLLKKREHLPVLYTMLFTMPGVPGVYYGSEYAAEGLKSQGDDALRPEFILSDYIGKNCALTEHITKLAKAHSVLRPLYCGDYRQVVLQNKYFAFARSCHCGSSGGNGDETVYSLINADSSPVSFNLGGGGVYSDVISGETVDISKPIILEAFGSMVLFQVKS